MSISVCCDVWLVVESFNFMVFLFFSCYLRALQLVRKTLSTFLSNAALPIVIAADVRAEVFERLYDGWRRHFVITEKIFNANSCIGRSQGRPRKTCIGNMEEDLNKVGAKPNLPNKYRRPEKLTNVGQWSPRLCNSTTNSSVIAEDSLCVDYTCSVGYAFLYR